MKLFKYSLLLLTWSAFCLADNMQPSNTDTENQSAGTMSGSSDTNMDTDTGTSVKSGSNMGSKLQNMAFKGCSTDVSKWCNDITPGQGRVAACLKAHDDKLTSSCRNEMQAMHNEMKDLKMSCRDDADRFCSSIEPGKGRVLSCLRDHQDQLSTSCKDQIAQMQSRMKSTG